MKTNIRNIIPENLLTVMATVTVILPLLNPKKEKMLPTIISSIIRMIVICKIY